VIHIPDSFFPRDDQGALLCPRCRKTTAACDCPAIEKPTSATAHTYFFVRVRLDKKGRQGKVVTLVSGLPSESGQLEELARQLKSSLGSGGTIYIEDGLGTIEIQGSHLQKAAQFLASQGFKVKAHS
jgi:translation initiation factor 1